MGGSSEVRAGRAYVEVFAKNQALEQGLRDSTRKLSIWSKVARAAVTSAVSTGGAVLGAGLVGAAVAGKAVAGAMTTVGSALSTTTAAGGKGFNEVIAALQKLTPISARAWDITQHGIGRGANALGVLRSLLAAAGPSAQPLLRAFDGLAQKSAKVVWWARAVAAIKGDFKTAGAYSNALQASREAFLSSGKATKLDWLNIRGGYLLTGAASTGLNLTGKALGMVANVGMKVGSSLAGAGATAVRSARSIVSTGSAASQSSRQMAGLGQSVASTEGRFAKLIPRLSSVTSAMKGASLRAGVIGGGILGALTAAAGVNGSLGEIFSAHGFAKYAAEIGDKAKEHGVSAEVYSSYQSAAQIAGVSLDEAKKDPVKMAQVESARRSAVSLGGITTTEQVAMAKAGTQATSEMSVAFRAVGTALGSAVLPQLIDGVRWITGTASAVASFIQQNQPLIRQLFAVGRAFAVGAAAAGAIATAIGFVASPIGLITLAIGGLTAAFPTLWAAAKEHFGSITGAIESMRDGFMTVFDGIVNALSSGNLGLAAEVAWAGLLVAWETGIGIANRQWTIWSSALANVLDSGLTEARIKLDAWFPGFEKTFSGTMSFLQDAWTVTVNWFLTVWDEAFRALQKSINYLQSLFRKGFDLKGANDAIDQAFNDRIKERGDGQAELLVKRDQERRRRDQKLAEHGTEAVLRGELAERKAQREAAVEASGQGSQRLKQAQDRLDLALKAAAAEKAKRDESINARVAEGTLKAKIGVSQRETRGAAANDIRTREGLADILVAFRGGRGNMQQQLLGKTTEVVKETQKGNSIHERNRLLLDHIDKTITFPSRAISGNSQSGFVIIGKGT